MPPKNISYNIARLPEKKRKWEFNQLWCLCVENLGFVLPHKENLITGLLKEESGKIANVCFTYVHQATAQTWMHTPQNNKSISLVFGDTHWKSCRVTKSWKTELHFEESSKPWTLKINNSEKSESPKSRNLLIFTWPPCPPLNPLKPVFL